MGKGRRTRLLDLLKKESKIFGECFNIQIYLFIMCWVDYEGTEEILLMHSTS